VKEIPTKRGILLKPEEDPSRFSKRSLGRQPASGPKTFRLLKQYVGRGGVELAVDSSVLASFFIRGDEFRKQGEAILAKIREWIPHFHELSGPC